MVRQLIMAMAAAILVTGAVMADDLYKVTITSASEARRLAGSGAEAVVRLDDGYLVLISSDDLATVAESGLAFDLVVSDVSRSRLAVDNRLDRANVEKYPLVFEQGNLRLYSLSQPAVMYRGTAAEIVPVEATPIPIEFTESSVSPEMLLGRLAPSDVPLDSLILGVSQDSLFALATRLQAFYRRTAGTDSNYASRDWIASKFTSYGYDSVVIDSFTSTIGGLPTACQNVLAYKVGTVYPNHHVIIGAHRDAVSASPGADDNGSGTVAVMEIARVLHDIPTDVTVIFALFDAEEYGLFGSYHYVSEAKARGDSIVYMLNMDMIAHYQNVDNANVFHGAITNYSSLFITLADSLVGIVGTLAGSSSGSDHYPFTQNGYDASFVAEQIFSTVYHTARDSMTYMSFPYMTRIVKACAATAYAVSQSYEPTASLLIAYTSPAPEILEQMTETPITVTITSAYGGTIVPGSVALHYRIENGSWSQVAMTEISPATFEANLPALDCFQRIRYYVSAEEATSGQFSMPPADDPNIAWAATGETVTFSDECNVNTGWAVSGLVADGQWTLGVPVGLGERGDPPTAFGGSGSCWLTDNVYGNSDVDGGTTNLSSPTFTADSTTRVSYAVWYSNSFGSNPHSQLFRVYLSNNNGSTWVKADSLGPIFRADGDWYEYAVWVKDVVTPTATMRLRFEASDIGAGAVVEAGVDAIAVTNYICLPPSCCIGEVGNVDGDGSDNVDIGDLTALIDNLFITFTPLVCVAEANCDNDPGMSIDIGDLTALIDNLYINFTPLPLCQ